MFGTQPASTSAAGPTGMGNLTSLIDALMQDAGKRLQMPGVGSLNGVPVNELALLQSILDAGNANGEAANGGGSGGSSGGGGGSSGGGSGKASGAGHSHGHHHHHHHHHHHKAHAQHAHTQSGAGTASGVGAGGSQNASGPGSTGSTGSGGAPAGKLQGTSGLKTDPNDPSHKLSGSIPKEMEFLRGDIENASHVSGVPANRIAAVIWAESRGNLKSPESSRNSDGTTDYGLMQIGQKRYDNDVKPVTGGPALDVRNTHDNVIAGALEMAKDVKDLGSFHKAHMAYIGHGNSDDAQYADAIDHDVALLDGGQQIHDRGGF